MENRYPGLAQMANDILAMPVAGVGVERIFSIAGNICTNRRSQLSPQAIRKLMLVRHRQSLMTPDDTEKEKHQKRKCYSSEDMEVLRRQVITTNDLRDADVNKAGNATSTLSPVTEEASQATKRKRHSA
jgi:hypothetical protein